MPGYNRDPYLTIPELFADIPECSVSSGGTDAPASGTVQNWTVSGLYTGFPPSGAFYIKDLVLTSEVILVIVGGSGTTSWTVIRGAAGTTPVSHSSPFTVEQVITSGSLGNFLQATALGLPHVLGLGRYLT